MYMTASTIAPSNDLPLGRLTHPEGLAESEGVTLITLRLHERVLRSATRPLIPALCFCVGSSGLGDRRWSAPEYAWHVVIFPFALGLGQ